MAAELFLYKLAHKLGGKKLGGKNNGGSGNRIGSIAANLASSGSRRRQKLAKICGWSNGNLRNDFMAKLKGARKFWLVQLALVWIWLTDSFWDLQRI
jgi:hypothetical protein